MHYPYYVVFNRYRNELQAFTLVSGEYEAMPIAESRLWMSKLSIGVGLWQSTYRDIERACAGMTQQATGYPPEQSVWHGGYEIWGSILTRFKLAGWRCKQLSILVPVTGTGSGITHILPSPSGHESGR